VTAAAGRKGASGAAGQFGLDEVRLDGSAEMTGARQTGATSTVGLMDVEQAIRTRRTHKAFAPAPLDHAVLEELIELARWAPTHQLRNPWRFRVLGKRTRQRLMELAEAAVPGSAVKLKRAPTLVAVSALLHGNPIEDREDLLASAVAAYLVLLGAHARGLAGYWRTVTLMDEPEGREILGLLPGESPLGMLYLGHPVQDQRVPERAPLAQIASYLD
jgi:nitroreductase